jgi:hypothetical protein
MIEPSIRGADDLAQLARALRAAGDPGKGLRKELYRGLQRATKPLKAKAQQAAAESLPQSGGLAQVVAAKSKISTRIMTGSSPRVSIQAKGVGVSTDKGFVRHRVFGTDAWVTQKVQGGWFTQTMKDSGPAVAKELNDAIDDVADRIKRSV